MSVEDKIKRAEEIYAKRQEGTQRKTATVSLNNDDNKKDIKLWFINKGNGRNTTRRNKRRTTENHFNKWFNININFKEWIKWLIMLILQI